MARHGRSCSTRRLALLFSLLSAAAGQGRTVHVDPAASPGGDGSAAAPLARLADGVAAVAFGDTLLLAAGRYQESIPLLVAGQPRSAILLLPDGVAVRGAGRGLTVLDVQPSPVLGFGITAEGVGPATTVQDLTVAGFCFQGINLRGASPTLERVDVLTEVTGASSVACDFRDGSRPLATDCVFAGGHGALFIEFGSGGTYLRCRIGRRPRDGLVMQSSDPVLRDCVLEPAGRYTVYCGQGSQPLLQECEIGRGDVWTVRVDFYAPGSEVDLSGNRWFTTNIEEIDAAIYDVNDDPSVGARVVFLPLAAEVDAASTSMGAVKSLFRPGER